MNLINSGVPVFLREQWLAVVALLGLLLVLGSSAGSAPSSFSQMIRESAPSVVTVLVEEEPEDAARRAAERAAAARESPVQESQKSASSVNGRQGLGSGFIISTDGLIVTNWHVIQGAARLRVRLFNGREFAARVVGADTPTDIALLKVDANHLPALHLASSKRVAVGDAVVAIGNPFGVGQSATAGIISARGRLLTSDPYVDFLQTDAAINHGNSGGPLLSSDGAVIGVTSTLLSPSGGSVGLGFAIPAETVANIVGELKTRGHVNRGYLGISAQPMTPELAQTLGVSPAQGVLLTAVEPQGPAAQMLLIGDVLLKINSMPVSFADLRIRTARLRPSTMVELAIIRNGVPREIYLTVGRLPAPPIAPPRAVQTDTWVFPLGLGVASTSYEIRHAIRADDETGGLIVTQLRPSGPGALAGLQIGDLLTHVGTRKLDDAAQLISVNTPSTTSPLLIRVVRDGAPQFIVVTGDPYP